ncbi:uncharacterized protein LOC107774839 isoform X1 [Nicotiana tabacum]|uniref:Uncharacterized protein LOC107774839 isoform X1 n=1 Tax=Nicotiana tabacum TaxID=4097 RepID=A0AC58RS55_TOBAC
MFKSQHGCCWSPRCHGQWWGYCTYWNEHGGSSSSKACCSFCCSCRHSQGILASLRHWSEGSDQYLSDRPLQKHGGGLEHNETYYGSCYGAEGSDDEAYRKKGWALSNLDIFDQLILEVGVEIGSFKTSLETSLRSKASYVTNKAIKKGRDPTPSEIHLHIHTHVAGEDKKRRVYGLGSQEKYYYGPNLYDSFGSDATSSATPLNAQSAPIGNMNELMTRLIPVLTDHIIPVIVEWVCELVSLSSQQPNIDPTNHPSDVAPIVPTSYVAANIDEVHVMGSDDDHDSPALHS